MILLTACVDSEVHPSNDSLPSSNEIPVKNETVEKIYFVIGTQEFEIVLYDNEASNNLKAQLPLESTFSDYNHTEKIAYLDNHL